MRGERERQATLLLGLTADGFVPQDHPLWRIKPLVDSALRRMSPVFDEVYAAGGRPSIPPEHLLKAVVKEAGRRRLLSADHFAVDGTLLEAWSSHMSYRPRDEPPPRGGGRNRDADFQGERRSRETHVSTTDPEARLYCKGKQQGAQLCYLGQVLTENRHGLVVDVELTEANGRAERAAALEMLERSVCGPATVGADRGDDTRDLVRRVRTLGVTQHSLPLA